jgi:diguanylate cyclase (GGDEF)-like protein
MRAKRGRRTSRTPAAGASPSGVALQPIVDLIDRVVLGYEALPRPPNATPQQIIDGALALAQLAAPAVIFVPVPQELLSTRGFDGAARARHFGANPGEVAWIVRRGAGGSLGQATGRRMLCLRELGFRTAVEGASSAMRNRSLIAGGRPDFVLLESGLPDMLLEDEIARADLAALVVFVARLGGRIIARGIDGDAQAAAVVELGVRYGVGPHLACPIVVTHDLAERGDERVSAAWFQQREVRVIRERGSTLRTPVEPAPITAVGTAELDEASFARLLVETARVLQAEHDPERILQVAAAHLFQAVPADRLAIFEADWESQRLRPRVLAGAGTEGFARRDISMSDGITGWAFARGQPYRCADTDSHPAAATIPGTVRIPESLLAVPLVAGDERLGMIDLWRTGLDAFCEEDLEHCALMGFITAAALRNAQMYVQLEQRALTDALTGLFNIRWWRDMSPRLAAQSLRTGAGVDLLMLDLDNFKDINDTTGHSGGDSVLRAVARALCQVIRESDYAVRYGGDEFLVVLTNSRIAGAQRVAEALQTAIAALGARSPLLGPVTASIGVAEFPLHGGTLDEVVQAADEALYAAKRAGRNRIIVAATPDAL